MYKWDVKNGFAYVLQFFSLISDSLGGVSCFNQGPMEKRMESRMLKNMWSLFDLKKFQTTIPIQWKDTTNLDFPMSQKEPFRYLIH